MVTITNWEYYYGYCLSDNIYTGIAVCELYEVCLYMSFLFWKNISNSHSSRNPLYVLVDWRKAIDCFWNPLWIFFKFYTMIINNFTKLLSKSHNREYFEYIHIVPKIGFFIPFWAQKLVCFVLRIGFKDLYEILY